MSHNVHIYIYIVGTMWTPGRSPPFSTNTCVCVCVRVPVCLGACVFEPTWWKESGIFLLFFCISTCTPRKNEHAASRTQRIDALYITSRHLYIYIYVCPWASKHVYEHEQTIQCDLAVSAFCLVSAKMSFIGATLGMACPMGSMVNVYAASRSWKSMAYFPILRACASLGKFATHIYIYIHPNLTHWGILLWLNWLVTYVWSTTKRFSQKSTSIYAWNPQNKAFSNQNKGHLGCRCIYTISEVSIYVGVNEDCLPYKILSSSRY